MSDELPEPWGSALSPKGVHSYGDLASGTGLSKGTCHRLVNGPGTPSVATVRKVATIYFAGDVDRVWDLRSSSRRDYGPWQVPEAVALLNPKQRAAIEAVIAAMVPIEGVAYGNASPTKAPAPGPADQPGTQHLALVADEDPRDIEDEQRDDSP